jgi:hypothetical protein
VGKLLLMSASVDTRPDRDINRVLVWAGGNEGDLSQYLPAMRMAEARLPSSDLNSAERTWERTQILREDIGFSPGAAEGIAFTVINELKGVEMRWPSLTCLGDATVQWGDVVQVRQNANDCELGISDHTMRLDGKRFRVQSVTHSGSGEGSGATSFSTQMGVSPLTASGF